MTPFNYHPNHVIAQETFVTYSAFDLEQNSISCSFLIKVKGKNLLYLSYKEKKNLFCIKNTCIIREKEKVILLLLLCVSDSILYMHMYTSFKILSPFHQHI